MGTGRIETDRSYRIAPSICWKPHQRMGFRLFSNGFSLRQLCLFGRRWYSLFILRTAGNPGSADSRLLGTPQDTPCICVMITPQNELSDSDKMACLQLWNETYPAVIRQKNATSFEAYLDTLEDVRHFLWREGENIHAWAAVFSRSGERWFLIMVAETAQRKGLGRQLLSALKTEERELSGWVVDSNLLLKTSGATYRSPLPFYLKEGFELCPEQFVTEVMETVKIHWTASLKGYKDSLESARIRTRFLTDDDIPAWADFLANPEATAHFHFTDTQTPLERSREWIERQLARYRSKQFGHQALIEKESGKFIGQCGILMQELNGKYVLEIGYHILPEFWGKGFAPEAARLFRQEAFERNWTTKVVSLIVPENHKSIRVAQKNGFQLSGQSKWNHLDVLIFESLKNS